MKTGKYKRRPALMILLAFVLAGCGKQPVEVPVLLEPSTSNESYRPVEYGDVGKINVAYGTVVPTDYCHFWLSQVTIRETVVDIGDHVEAGDVLAYADIDAARDAIEQLDKQLTLENSIFSVDEELYQFRHQELELKLTGAQSIGDNAAAAQASTDIAVLEENHRYDTLLHQYRVNGLNESIADQKEIVTDGTLVARAAGYVTYVKDISSGGTVTANENVVIVSDYDDCYVEMTGITVSEDYQRNWMPYDTYYTEIAGKKYALKEYAYAPDELVVIENKSMYPDMRMQFEDTNMMPEAGTNIPVFMTGDIVEDVLLVGNDSIYEDTVGTFVYVKKDDSRELRYIETGKTGENYTEVISGLEEGEMVYYSSDSILPETYTAYTVETSDYEPKCTANTYSVEDMKNKTYYSEYEGRITSVSVREGDSVSAGDLICTIKTSEGSARLTELSNAIDDLRQNYQNTENGYTEQINALENQMAEIWQQNTQAQQTAEDTTEDITEDTTGDTATDTDADPAQNEQPEQPQDPYLYQELALQIEQIKAEEKKNTLNYNYQLASQEAEYEKASCNNDGNGTIRIYAETAGTIMNLNVKEGKNVKVGDRMFGIGVSSSDKVLFRSSDKLHLNQKLVFYEEDSNKTYTGEISGTTGDSSKIYVTKLDGKVYLTNNISEGNALRYYVKMDDDMFYESEKKCIIEYSVNSIQNTFVLPRGIVYSEKNDKSDALYYYVWRIEEDSLVKQYVVISEDGTGNSPDTCVITGLKTGDVLARDESK